MVILQFNKLIRNKWVWGAFAIVISAAFCFDDLFTKDSREERKAENAGTLAGEVVDSSLFADIQQDERGIGRNADYRTPQNEVNEAAWRTYAALQVAKANGLEATDDEVRAAIRRDRSFSPDGKFSFRYYQLLLRENGISPERFEEYLKRRLTLQKLSESVLASAIWVSPMELERASADYTDNFTVKVADFTFTKEAAEAVTVDDAQIEKWYNDHKDELKLPQRYKIRMIKFDATTDEVLAKMTVTEDDMRDMYDASIDKYTKTDTNGVETVTAFEEVKGDIEKNLRQIAAVEYYTTNMNQRIYQPGATLDGVAKEENAEVTTSDWFFIDGNYQEGFMKYASQIAPGAQDFNEAVAELDPTSPDLKYGVVASDNAVWVIEQAEVSPEHTPDLAEAKDAIRPRVLRDAKADAFKAQVEAVIAQGKDAVLNSGNISTNYTFAVCDLKAGDIPDMQAVARAASKLTKDQISDFTKVGVDRAIVVVCENREPGDAAKATLMSAQLRQDLETIMHGSYPEAWLKTNLERMTYVPGDINGIEVQED